MKETNRNKITVSEWAAALGTSQASDVVLPGYKTAEQIAKDIGRSVGYTGRLILKRLAEGKLDRKVFMIQKRDRPYPTPHYKIIEPRH